MYRSLCKGSVWVVWIGYYNITYKSENLILKDFNFLCIAFYASGVYQAYIEKSVEFIISISMANNWIIIFLDIINVQCS